jgi:4-amino-4-deoxy-L-arabinose transferase-like glycosyltransferase
MILRSTHRVWIILLAYAAGFLVFRPRVLLINDEERYVAQAVAFAHGALNFHVPEGVPASPSGTPMASDYPPGTSLLQAPFVRAGGWRWAAALSVMCLALLVACTRGLLRELRLPAAYAAYALASVAALFFGRVAMSDVPAAALMALALWLVIRSERADASVPRHLLAGAASGACLLFREPVVVLLAPFLLASLRQPKRLAWLAAGGLAAIGLRLLLSELWLSDALYVRDGGYGFSVASIARNAPLYAVVLMVMVPFAAVLPALYRGPLRSKILMALGLYLLVFLAYDYNAWRDNGMLRGTLLAARFMVPALPLLAVMCAEVVPRLLSRLRLTTARTGALAAVLHAGLALLALAIHPLARQLEQPQYELLRAVQRAPADVPAVINEKVTGKFVSPVYGERMWISRARISADSLPALCRRFGGLVLVLVDRNDTELFRDDARGNAAFLAAAAMTLPLTPLHDEEISGMRLRMLRVGPC